MTVLDEETKLKIEALSEDGNFLLEEEKDWRGALLKWELALALLPNPKVEYSEALWLYASIGEAYYIADDKENALAAYEEAYHCPDGHVNPYVLLQLGKLYADNGNEGTAAKMLLRAYMMEGDRLFESEQFYFDFLNKRIDLSDII